MTRPPVLVLLSAFGHTHASEVGTHLSMCGLPGTTHLQQVRSSFDFTCERCVPLVQEALGLTSLNDPGNAGFIVVDEDES